jgi:hypothetical protein
MRSLWLVAPLLLVGCSSIKYVTVDHGRIVTQDNKHVNIVGNPPMVCHYPNSTMTFSGYFIYQQDDGTIVLDDFGRGNIYLQSDPICELRLDTNESN